MCTRRPKQQDTANFSFERIQNVHETSKKARCGQLFHSKEFKMCTRRPKQQDTANFFIRNYSKFARDVQNSKIRPTILHCVCNSWCRGVILRATRFKMCMRRPKQQDTANFFIPNHSKCARDVQNSKIRPTFSSELSQNVHEKCLLTGHPNTTRRGQLFHLKVDKTVSWPNISNRAT